jgi:hypothetical protein
VPVNEFGFDGRSYDEWFAETVENDRTRVEQDVSRERALAIVWARMLRAAA